MTEYSEPLQRRVRLLVTGFGSFADVVDNPSGWLAMAVDGYLDESLEIVGRVLPVSYARGPAEAVTLARDLDVDGVVGIGVAVNRTGVSVERRAVRFADPLQADVDGACLQFLQTDGPDERLATIPVARFAEELGAEISDDAGRYVCNAWLYTVASELGDRLPVGFVHVPSAGLDPAKLIAALKLLAAPAGGRVGRS